MSLLINYVLFMFGFQHKFEMYRNIEYWFKQNIAKCFHEKKNCTFK